MKDEGKGRGAKVAEVGGCLQIRRQEKADGGLTGVVGRLRDASRVVFEAVDASVATSD